MSTRFRQSALFGPSTTYQWINRLKWALIIPLPFILYFQKKRVMVNAQLPPLLENDLQPIDYSIPIRQWNEVKSVLKPVWQKKVKLSGDQAIEAEFLKDFTWTAEISRDPDSNRSKSSSYVPPIVSWTKINRL
jgi:hypothetical protein